MVRARLATVLVSLSMAVPAHTAADDAPVPAGTGEAKQAQEVVASYLEAIGGLDAIKAVGAKRMTYWVHMLGRDAYLMERSWTRPAVMKAGRSGSDTYTLTEGEKSWRVSPAGREELPAAVARSLGKLADIDGPLVDWRRKGVTLAYSGLVSYDMADLHQVTATFPDGQQWELFFDARGGLLRKTIQPSFRMQGNEVTRGSDTHNYFYDYRRVGDVLYPHSWIQQTEEYTHLFVIESLQATE